MIMRILGEAQYEIDAAHLDELNDLDAAAQRAVESGDERAFAAALRDLLDAVRRLGTPLPADVLTPSDLVLPGPDAGLAEVAELLSGEGLIPG
ncbi:PspA-associated protein PspAA [Streptomyces sp. 6N223]|uniref:PspA-associated protein PspAA n=1 Tax=Streptomyces sp. 6N223 TaxID=3457412 RepID=UPI003FD4AB32